MGVLNSVELVPLAVFALATLLAGSGLVLLSGFLPIAPGWSARHRLFLYPLVGMGLMLVLALAAVGLVLVLDGLPLAVAVLAGGLALLAAPFLVEPLPPGIRDGVSGPALFVLIALGVLIWAIFMVTG